MRLEDALFSARATRQQFCPWEFRAPAPEGESPTERREKRIEKRREKRGEEKRKERRGRGRRRRREEER